MGSAEGEAGMGGDNMIWKFTMYNGSTWEAPCQMLLSSAIEAFIKATGKTEWDIKRIDNLH
jgi:hypothetical protein